MIVEEHQRHPDENVRDNFAKRGKKWFQSDKMSSVSKIMRGPKNKHGHNFQNIASKTNQRGLIVYEPTLIQFGADILKIVAVSVFCNGS